MMKAITIILCVLLISSNSFAGLFSSQVVMPDFEKIKREHILFNNVYDGLSVVEVLGSGKGSGVLVLLDERIVVLTNSHNIQGRDSAQITLPDRQANGYWGEEFGSRAGILGFKGEGQVLYDFPLSDVAILSLPEEQFDVDQKIYIRKYAQANGVLSSKKGWTPSKSGSLARDAIVAVLNGKSTVVEGVEGHGSGMIKDTYISGDESPIWVAPVYSKPGMSGGAYYRNGVLEGLVTKISLGGFPMTLATPIKKIAELIQSPPSIEKQISWKDGLMVYKGKDKIVTVNPLGNGWLGNGGELLDVVDESETGDSNPNYWRLEYRKSFYGKGIITTWDPFVFRPGNFVVGNENISFVKMKSRTFFRKTESYMIPTLAKFVYSEKSKSQITFYPNTIESANVLKEARLQPKFSITHGRVFQFEKKEKFFQLKTGNSRDEVLPTLKTAFRKDTEGYLSDGTNLASRPGSEFLFDVKINAEWIKFDRHITVQAPKNLSEVVIKFSSEYYTEYKSLGEVVLRPEEFNSPQSLVFKSEDGKHKAIFMYANDDLTALVRAYIVTGDVLIELWGAL